MIPVTAEEIIGMHTKQLWDTLQILLEEETENGDLEEVYKEEIQIIKYGKLNIPIWYITQKWFEEMPVNKKVKVLGHGKFDLEKFMEDKSKRDTIMRSILIENIEEGGITEGRN